MLYASMATSYAWVGMPATECQQSMLAERPGVNAH